MKRVATGIYLVALLFAASWGVSAATRAGVLIPIAVPFALILIVAARLAGPQPELIAWAVFTAGLLGSTYLQTRSPIEYGMFLIYLVLAGLGVFKSPYFLALAWLFHPVWDFVPRDLPPQLLDLPLACLLYDIPIGLYLLWGARRNRWTPIRLRAVRAS